MPENEVRTLTASYEERGMKTGTVKVYVDDREVCALHNGEAWQGEISEDAHDVRVRVWGLLPVFHGVITAGQNSWALGFQDGAFIGKFVLSELKPLKWLK